jgi:signal transduction histidine kinase
MRGKHSLFYHILIFVIAQIVWLSLLGLWIYWYISNYIIYEKAGEQVSPQLLYDVQNALPFVLGLILLIGLSFMTSVIFRDLNVQIRLTKLYDNFIGNVTHELKSPLSSIQLYLETMRQRDVPAEKQKEFIEMMLKDTGRLQRLINSILEISAHENRKLQREYQLYKADQLLTNVAEESFESFRIGKENYEITGSTNAEIIACRDSMKIAIDNLTDNAVKYSEKKPVLKLKFYDEDRKLIIEFKDNGIGIPVKERKKIFKKFYRIDNKDIPNVKGTGLGLYRIKEIIKAHGGKVFVSDNGNEPGTTFHIKLPVYPVLRKKLLIKSGRS